MLETRLRLGSPSQTVLPEVVPETSAEVSQFTTSASILDPFKSLFHQFEPHAFKNTENREVEDVSKAEALACQKKKSKGTEREDGVVIGNLAAECKPHSSPDLMKVKPSEVVQSKSERHFKQEVSLASKEDLAESARFTFAATDMTSQKAGPSSSKAPFEEPATSMKTSTAADTSAGIRSLCGSALTSIPPSFWDNSKRLLSGSHHIVDNSRADCSELIGTNDGSDEEQAASRAAVEHVTSENSASQSREPAESYEYPVQTLSPKKKALECHDQRPNSGETHHENTDTIPKADDKGTKNDQDKVPSDRDTLPPAKPPRKSPKSQALPFLSSDSDADLDLPPSFRPKATPPPSPTPGNAFLERIRAQAAAGQKARVNPVSSTSTDDLMAKIKADAAARVEARRADKPISAAKPVTSAPAVFNTSIDLGIRRSSRARRTPSSRPATLTQSRRCSGSRASPDSLLHRLLVQRRRDQERGTDSSKMAEFSRKVLADVESGRHLQDDSDHEVPTQGKLKAIQQQQAQALASIRQAYAHWVCIGSHEDASRVMLEAAAKSPSDTLKAEEGFATEETTEIRNLLAEVKPKYSPKRPRTSSSSSCDRDEGNSNTESSVSPCKRGKVHDNNAVTQKLDVVQLLQQDAGTSVASKDTSTIESMKCRMFFSDFPIRLPRQPPKLAPLHISHLPPEAQHEWDQLQSFTLGKSVVLAWLAVWNSHAFQSVEPVMLSTYLDMGFLSYDRLGLSHDSKLSHALAAWLLSLSLLADPVLAASAFNSLHLLMATSLNLANNAVGQGIVSALPGALLQLGATKEAVGFAFPHATPEYRCSHGGEQTSTESDAVCLTRSERAIRLARILDVVQDAVKSSTLVDCRVNLTAFAFRLSMDPLESPVARCRYLSQCLVDGATPGMEQDASARMGLDERECQDFVHRASLFLQKLPLTAVYFAALHALPIGSDKGRVISRRIAASCILRNESSSPIDSDPDVAAISRCAILLEQALQTACIPGNPFAAQREDEQPDWVQMRAAAHLISFVAADVRALQPMRRPHPTSSSGEQAGVAPRASPGGAAIASPISTSTPVPEDAALQRQRTALIRLEAALRLQSGRITDNNGVALEKSLARDALLRTSLELRYLLRAAGATQRGLI